MKKFINCYIVWLINLFMVDIIRTKKTFYLLLISQSEKFESISSELAIASSIISVTSLLFSNSGIFVPLIYFSIKFIDFIMFAPLSDVIVYNWLGWIMNLLRIFIIVFFKYTPVIYY